jgi:hypothetical protein
MFVMSGCPSERDAGVQIPRENVVADMAIMRRDRKIMTISTSTPLFGKPCLFERGGDDRGSGSTAAIGGGP